MLPAALIAIPKGGYIVIIMLTLSLIGLVFNRGKLALGKWEKYFVFSFVFYFIVIVINVWWFDGKLHDIDTPSRLLLVLPIYFFIRKTTLSINWLVWGIAIGAVLTGLLTFGTIDTHYVSKVFSVQTGNFSLFSAILGLSSIMFISKSNSYLMNTLLISGFILGIVASIALGGRGVWISTTISIIILLFINPINWGKGAKFVVFLSFIGILVTAYLIPQTDVKNRIYKASSETISWIENGKSDSSVGARLEMWKASFEIIKENPLIGVGEDNYAKSQQVLIDQGKIDKFVGRFYHPHSEYITSLVEQGAIGLLAFILLLFLPLKHLLNVLQKNTISSCQKSLVATGLVVIFHYLFYSFTANVLAHQSTVLFYAIFLVVINGYISMKDISISK